LQRSSAGAKHQVVDELLIAAGQATQIIMQSEGNHITGHWQQQGLVIIEPGLDLVMTTFGAEAVFA
jgi:hypothetical protein